MIVKTEHYFLYFWDLLLVYDLVVEGKNSLSKAYNLLLYYFLKSLDFLLEILEKKIGLTFR